MSHQQQPRLVNKQFNSPIGLYSEQNIRDIIQRESQMLDNGAVGIDFHNPNATKPTNLHNSAVLRMLEEEEGRQRAGQNAGFRSDGKPLRACWPPPGHNRPRRFTDVVISGAKRVAWPPPREGEENEIAQTHEAVQAQGGPQFTTNQNGPQVQRPVTPTPNKPTWSPVQQQQQQQQQSPINPASPLPYQQHQQQQQQQQQPFAQVRNQPSPQPYSAQPQPQWSPVPVAPVAQAVPLQTQQTPQYQQVPVKQFEPPPTIITLRPTVPISQAPAPVITSQPATATLRGGKNLRGDLKWPPEDVREKMDAENRALMELAKGPACRPRRVAKDYSPFFAQHALNSSYPGYKVPPGTQFYDHHPVW